MLCALCANGLSDIPRVGFQEWEGRPLSRVFGGGKGVPLHHIRVEEEIPWPRK